jgi:hypothetical protein
MRRVRSVKLGRREGVELGITLDTGAISGELAAQHTVR